MMGRSGRRATPTHGRSRFLSSAADSREVLDDEIDKRIRIDEALLEATYQELRRIARGQLARRNGASLVATELVHEAYLRLSSSSSVEWDSRAHFFGAAAESMRRVLVDRARRKGTLKRGERRAGASLTTCEVAGQEKPEELLDLDEALSALEERDPRLSMIVKFRYFAGLSVSETAAMLGTTDRTVFREWATARAWLRTRIEGGHVDG